MRAGTVILGLLLSWAPSALALDAMSQALQQQQWPTVLETLQRSRQLPDARSREPRLYGQLQRMLNTPVSDPAIRQWIGTLRGYRAELRRPANPEHPGSPQVDSYPIGALATQLLQRWQTLDQAQAWVHRWRSGDLALADDIPILTAALERAELPLLQALISTHATLPTPAMAVIAARLNQPDVHRRWLMQAPDADVIVALPSLAEALGSAAARELLIALRVRPSLRGAINLALAELPSAGIDDKDIAIWIQQLSDPEAGASSARALAGLSHDSWVKRLPLPASAIAWQNTLLALHWSEQAAAQAQLRAWLADADVPEHMRKELSLWRP